MRSKGVTLLELLVALAVIGIIAVILVPWLMCHLEKARNARIVGEVRQAAVMVEQYMIDMTVPPDTLEDAYAGTNTPMPDGLFYCSGWYNDPNSGHGNDCDFDDEGNPGNSSPGEKFGVAGMKYIIRTDALTCGCTDVYFVWVAGDPTVRTVQQGGWTGKLPGRIVHQDPS